MDYFNTRGRAEQLGFPIKDFHHLPPLGHRIVSSTKPHRVNNVASELERQKIVRHFEEDATFYDVGVQGLPSNTEVGSRRITAYDEGFARFLSGRLFRDIHPEILDMWSPVDWESQNPDKLNYWVPLGVSPVFRYMRYRNGSQHYTHYDAPFINPKNPLIRTLKSGVLYLTDSATCCTCFVNDYQHVMPFRMRDHSDWTRETKADEITEAFQSVAGTALLFFHQLPHFVTPNEDDHDRIIIRFDVTYKAVGRV